MDAKLEAAGAIAFAVTLFLIFAARPLARHLGLVDKPGERKRHRGRVPLVGGVCFFAGTVVAMSYVGYVDRQVAALLVPAALVVLVGVLDDLYDLSVRLRLVVQASAALVAIGASGLYLDHLGNLFGNGPVALGLLGIPLTVFAVIGLINAFNMLDGIDGLAASMAMTSIAAILLFSGIGAGAAVGVVVLLQVLFSALLPYLFVNLGWPDGRKIFMGDAGSTLLGFTLACSIVFLANSQVALLSPVDALWCIALPVMDTLGVMARRARKGVSVFKPDRQHLHHLLIDAGLSARMALATIVCGALMLVGLGYALRPLPELASLAVFAGVLVAYVLYFQSALGAVRRAVHRPGAVREGGSPGVGATTTSTPMRALCVVGTSPDTLQLAPILRALERDDRFETRVCLASGIDDTSERVLELLDIHADARVDVGTDGGATATVDELKTVLGDFEPDVVLVPSGSPATLPTTLAALYHQVPVACIESGLPDAAATRREDGFGRRLTGMLAAVHIAPSDVAGRSLVADGVPAERVVVARHATASALHDAMRRAERDAGLGGAIARRLDFLRPGSPLVLVACCDGLKRGFGPLRAALSRLLAERPDLDIVCALDRDGEAEAAALAAPGLHFVAPDDYIAFAALLDRAVAVVASPERAADFVGLGKPLLMLQPPDTAVALDAPNVLPTRVDVDSIVAGGRALLSDAALYAALNLAGRDDAEARARIADTLARLRGDRDGVPPEWTPPMAVEPPPACEQQVAART